tara:strand:- start:252 stop:863 length:612 start_codon:yes stop_codon:yes gene_type:complete
MKYDYTSNIIFLGEINVGKTTLIHNYINSKKKNITDLSPTIGIDYYKKVIHNENKSYLVHLWDTGNGLLYINILKYYLKKSNIFVIVLKLDSIKFINDIFDIIKTNVDIKPTHIHIVYNKYINTDDTQLPEEFILKCCPPNIKLYFCYINILESTDNNILFNNLNLDIYEINQPKKLQLHNLDNNITLPEQENNLCDKCCIIC